MAATKYTYLIDTDFTNLKVATDRLSFEIQGSDIITALDRIDTNENDCDIWFKDSLSTGDKTILDGLVGTHDGEPLKQVQVVHPDFSTLENPNLEVQRVALQPGRTHYYMNFRDYKINTGIFAEADSFEDLRVNPADNKRQDWGEMTLVGCYKGDDVGGYTLCTDQTDADTNATLSIWDYVANDQESTPSPVDIDMMGGVLWVDPNLTGAGDDIWKHQFYALMAPGLPTSVGGAVPFFDCYLRPYQGEWASALNTLALKLDPSATVEAARIRFWLYYPAGAKQTHILGLKSYRNKW
jgi:hypothetical protein